MKPISTIENQHKVLSTRLLMNTAIEVWSRDLFLTGSQEQALAAAAKYIDQNRFKSNCIIPTAKLVQKIEKYGKFAN